MKLDSMGNEESYIPYYSKGVYFTLSGAKSVLGQMNNNSWYKRKGFTFYIKKFELAEVAY